MEAQEIILATNDGVVKQSRQNGPWQESGHAMLGQEIRTVVAREGVILAGTKNGIFRSVDGGDSWSDVSTGLTVRHVRWLAFNPAVSDSEFAGTEPAGIFVSSDGGDRWAGRPEVAELRDKFHWFLPYSPEAGCVRGFAFHGDRVYAAVEVGGVLRSDDAGATWRLARGSSGEPNFDIPPAPLVHPDVHSVYSHPSSPDLVFAATAEGLYTSSDAGDTWTVAHAGSYCRAAWIDPDDPKHQILGSAQSVARKHGRIEESRDGGKTWTDASEGLDLPWPDRMVERFTQFDDLLFAVTSDGRAFGTSLRHISWQRLFDAAGYVNALAPMS